MQPLFYLLNRALKCLLVLSLLGALRGHSLAQTIRYVKPADGRTTKNGLSWATAYDQNQLQQAIYETDAASGSDKQVWVAAGTYKPGTNRYSSFYMRDQVAIYGGFAATGSPTMMDRNPASFTTILSGELGNSATNEDNAYAVVLNSGFALYGPNSRAVGPTAIMDGFTITGGQAKGGYEYFATFGGGGMCNNASSPTVRNCRFTGNAVSSKYEDYLGSEQYGGGMLNQESSPTLINCRFDHNVARYGGGGMACIAFTGENPSKPILINCSFEDNFAAFGGGVYNLSSNYINNDNQIQLVNCRFTTNSAGQGGALHSECDSDGISTQVTLINCSLVGNSTDGYGGAISNFSRRLTLQLINCSLLNNTTDYLGSDIYNNTNFPNANPDGPPITRLVNCIVWGGSKSFQDGSGSPKKFTTVSYSLLQSDIGNYVDGGNNIKSNIFPFVSTTDLRLQAGSVAINAGSTSAYQAANGADTDLGGLARLLGGGIDLGAFELPSDLTPRLTSLPTLQYGTTPFSVVVEVFELNGVSTGGAVSLFIAKDPQMVLSFEKGLSQLGGKPVGNGSWSFDGTSNPNFYLLSCSAGIGASGKQSVGLSGVSTPDNTKGRLTISTSVSGGSGMEGRLTNNSDADTIEYFKK